MKWTFQNYLNTFKKQFKRLAFQAKLLFFKSVVMRNTLFEVNIVCRLKKRVQLLIMQLFHTLNWQREISELIIPWYVTYI